MLPDVPSESAYAYWVTRCIEEYFLNLGYDFCSEFGSQRKEIDYPFDVYASVAKGDMVKRFGLQFKRPHIRKARIHWKLDKLQYERMKKFGWIYYALPDFTDRKFHRNACHHVIFTGPDFPFSEEVNTSNIRYHYRMGKFAESIINCPMGERLKGRDWEPAVKVFRALETVNFSIFYLDMTERKGLAFSGTQLNDNLPF